MLGRVPATDRTVSWRLQGCSYYTALPAGREHPQLLREMNDPEARRGAPRRQRSGRRLGLRRARAVPGQPRPEAAGLLGGPHRRRGLRAAVPRPRDRRGPARGGAAHLLRRRVEQRVGPLLLHGPRRRLPPVPGVAARPRHAGGRRRAGARGAGRALRAERAGDPQRRPGRDLGGEPRHPGGVGGRRRVADGAAALGRRPASGHRVPRRARRAPRRHGHPAGGHQRRRHRVPARPLPGAPRRATRTTPPGRRPGPSAPTSGWSGWTRSPGTPCSASGRRPSTGCACVPLDALDGRGLRDRAGVRLRHGRDRPQHRVRRRRR